jgi:hypothetical protein
MEPANNVTFQHQPLNALGQEFRPLTVTRDLRHAGRETKFLCNVQIFDLSWAPAYTAVSYTWGSDTLFTKDH